VYRQVEGQKTRLRPALWGFSEDELRRRYRWSQDDVLQYWSGSIPGGRSLAQFRESVSQRDWPSDGKRVSYAILTHENALVGMISCYNIDHRQKTGELGVYLGEKDYWGQGYGTDALIVFLQHLFGDLQFDSVYLHTYESNIRAQRSYVNAGFELSDKRRRYSPRLGYHEEVRMTISKERFGALHKIRESSATV
jgi:ribosomal-protein-alanine N-acetyltransferase